MIEATPGLEDKTKSDMTMLHPKDVVAICRNIIRREMEDKLLPFEGRRKHRKTHGMLKFLEMSQMMCAQWKLVDESIKTIFQELADESKRLYRERLSEYESEKREVINEEKQERVASPVCQDVEIDNDSVVKMLSSLDTHSQDTTSDNFFENVSPLPFAEHEYTDHLPPPRECIPCTPKPLKCEKVHIVSPVTSRPVYKPPEAEPEVEVGANDGAECLIDDFCEYIDEHIHLVDEAQLNTFDQEYDETPSNFMDLITMNESIDHFNLSNEGFER